jgi:hypothetical protein
MELAMTMQNYRSTLRANIAAQDAFDKIADASEWWSKGMVGTATAVGDSFKIDWAQAWVCMEVVEAVPGKRSTWH